MIEIFKDVRGYEGRYKISNLGRVKSLVNRNVKDKEYIMTPAIDKGYAMVNLMDAEGKQKKHRINRLVLMSFEELPDNYEELVVDHIDNNKLNNNLDNLQWLTLGQNNRKGHKENGTLRPCIDLTTNKTYECMNDLAKELGCHNSSVRQACIKGYQCKGHRVRFI